MGILNRIGRGKFVVGEGKHFITEISSRIETLNRKLKKEFPYINVCIWNTSVLNEFMIHQPGCFYLLIEVDKEATQSVFHFLRDTQYSVFIEPTKDLIEKYFPSEGESLIVKPLVSEAPVQYVNGIKTPTLEKILVDVFCDDVIFSAQQGMEMRVLFKEALGKYTLYQSRMIRYADRRGKKDSFTKYINSVLNLRQ